MVHVQCPQCRSVVEATPGETITCDTCGYSAPFRSAPPAPDRTEESVAALPAPAPSESTPPKISLGPPPVPRVRSSPTTGAQVLAPWGYLCGLVGLALFFLAQTGIPFLMSLLAIGLGAGSLRMSPPDRRSPVAIALGAVGILAAGLYLVT